jgi:hypothetical protein
MEWEYVYERQRLRGCVGGSACAVRRSLRSSCTPVRQGNPAMGGKRRSIEVLAKVTRGGAWDGTWEGDKLWGFPSLLVRAGVQANQSSRELGHV